MFSAGLFGFLAILSGPGLRWLRGFGDEGCTELVEDFGNEKAVVPLLAQDLAG